MIDLLVAPCDYKASKYAVEHWHYSKTMPAGRLIKFGVWEDNQFKGSIIYGLGASNNLCKGYNLKQGEICELVRIALKDHKSSVTKIVSKTIKELKKDKYLKLIVSFADSRQKHLGIIYQAGNWLYVGKSDPQSYEYYYKGRWIHNRTVNQRVRNNRENKLIKAKLKKRKTSIKYKYLMPLDKKIRKQLLNQSKAYPKKFN